jgi:hypothetical protein
MTIFFRWFLLEGVVTTRPILRPAAADVKAQACFMRPPENIFSYRVG